MLGIYISIFVILANILFICAIYSCIKVAFQNAQTDILLICHSLCMCKSFIFPLPSSWSSFQLQCRLFQRRLSSRAPTAPWLEYLPLSSSSSLPLLIWYDYSQHIHIVHKPYMLKIMLNTWVCMFGLTAVCLWHQELGTMRSREAEHLCSAGDALFDPHLECVHWRGSGDLF